MDWTAGRDWTEVNWRKCRQTRISKYRLIKRRQLKRDLLSASSYEPGNRAGSVTGMNYVVCSYEEFQPGRPGRNQETIKIVEHKHISFATVIALWTLVNSENGNIYKTKTMPYVTQAKLSCLEHFVPVTGLEPSYGKIFIPVTEISVAKTDISVTRAVWPFISIHRNFYAGKWHGEISETEPARLTGLMWKGPLKADL